MNGNFWRVLLWLSAIWLTGAPAPAQTATAPSAQAFGHPQRVTLQGYDDDAMEPFLSRDGRYLLFNNRNEAPTNTNLNYAERVDDLTFRYRGELQGVNTEFLEGVPTLDRDGHFYFVSSRSYASTASTLYAGRFEAGRVTDVTLLPGISGAEPGIVNFDVEVSPDGQNLYFVDARFGPTGPETADLVIARRNGSGFERLANSAELLRHINTSDLEYAACISADGRSLLFTRARMAPTPLVSIFLSTRAQTTEPFDPPTRLEALDGFVEAATFSPDESAIYYHRQEGGRFVLYRANRWGSIAAQQRIVFMAPTGSSPFPEPENPGAWELVVMDLDGSSREQLTHNTEQEFLPHFSPDGTRLLYTRYLSGGYGIPGARSRVSMYDFATHSSVDLTSTDQDSYPVWSPDGQRIAFLSTRDPSTPGNGLALWVMNADGSDAHQIGQPSGHHLDYGWGDIAWSSQDWILLVVAENKPDNSCFKTRLDQIRPDGSGRTQITDGGPHCTPSGFEQNGDADPGYSADGATIYSSRGLPLRPPGFPGGTVRRLYAVSSTPWTSGKPEQDLSPPGGADCIEGVPKASPDGQQILLFRACAGERPGLSLSDAAGRTRTRIADGFGPDWNPARLEANQHGLGGLWYASESAGQGFALEVSPDLRGPGEGYLFGGWFTFDTLAGGSESQRWLSFDGLLRSGANIHPLTLYRNVNGQFASGPATTAQPVGSATLSFDNCQRGTLDYAFSDAASGSGRIVLQRLTPNLECASGPAKPQVADAGLSGFWYDPAASGQGIYVELNVAQPLAFVAWYTYVPGGQPADAPGQRWYTAQALYVAGERSMQMPLYETVGGTFARPNTQPTRTVTVGSATLHFFNCAQAELHYDFAVGSHAGRQGVIQLARLVRVPDACQF